jgi:hypothetical protein
MKTGRTVIGALLAGLIGSSAPALAADVGQNGAGASAYQHGSDEAVLDRVGDWFATLGKSGLEKDSILVQRRTARAAKRAQKTIEHQVQNAEQGLHEAGEGLKKGLDSMTSRQ